MINTIRADFYRLKWTRGFWIAQVILLMVVIISILSQSTGSITINDMNELNDLEAAKRTLTWTGVVSLKMMGSMMTFLLYIIWPLLVIIVGHDFSKQTYKNSLTVGVSRTAYFFSKYITMTLITLIQVVYYYLISFSVASVINGVGSDFNVKFLMDTLLLIGIQLIFLSAIIAIALLALYLTSNIVTTVLTGIIVPILLAILPFALPNLTFLSYFNFQDMANNMMTLGLDFPNLGTYILVALLSIIALVTASLFIFKKREL